MALSLVLIFTSATYAQVSTTALKNLEEEIKTPSESTKLLVSQVEKKTQEKGFSSRLEKEISRYRVKFTIDALGNDSFDEDGLDGRSYYQFIVEPTYKNNEQVRKDIWVLDLRANKKAVEVGTKVKLTYVRYFAGKNAKWDAIKAPVKFFWHAPMSTNDLKEKLAVGESFRYEFSGDLTLKAEKVSEIGSKLTANTTLAYARSGLIVLDLHKFTEKRVRSRFIGIKNRGELRGGVNTEQIDGFEFLPGKLRDWLSIGLNLNARGTFTSFIEPTGIDSVLLDQVFNFETEKALSKEKLKNDSNLAEAALEEIFDTIKNGKLPLAFLTITKDGDLMRVLNEVSQKANQLAKTDYKSGRTQNPFDEDARVINVFRGRSQTGLLTGSIGAKLTGLIGGKSEAGSLISYVTTLDTEDRASHYWLDSSFIYQTGRSLFGRNRVDILKDLDVLVLSDANKNVGDIQDAVVNTQIRDSDLSQKQVKDYRKIIRNSLPIHIKNSPDLNEILKENTYTNAGIVVRKAYGHQAFKHIGSLNRPQLTMQLIEFFDNHPYRHYMQLPSDRANSDIGLGTFAEQKAHQLANIFEPNTKNSDSLEAFRIAKRDPLFEMFIVPDFLANLLPASAPMNTFRVDLSVSSGDHGTAALTGGTYQTSNVFDAVSYLRTLFTNQPIDTREIRGVDLRN